MNQKLFSEDFIKAIKDYQYLMMNGYPKKAALKIAGDKIGANKFQRTILYRGISELTNANERKSKLVTYNESSILHVDTYNVLFTISNYLYGTPLFICVDGLLRDAGEIHTSFHDTDIFNKSIDILLNFLDKKKDSGLLFLLDSPIPHSKELTKTLNKKIKEHKVRGEAITVRSPDNILISKCVKFAATSDSIIIDKTPAQVIDLPFEVLSKNYNAKFVKLTDFL